MTDNLISSVKAMDQPDHVTRFLPHLHFILCNPVSIKNMIIENL